MGVIRKYTRMYKRQFPLTAHFWIQCMQNDFGTRPLYIAFTLCDNAYVNRSGYETTLDHCTMGAGRHCDLLWHVHGGGQGTRIRTRLCSRKLYFDIQQKLLPNVVHWWLWPGRKGQRCWQVASHNSIFSLLHARYN